LLAQVNRKGWKDLFTRPKVPFGNKNYQNNKNNNNNRNNRKNKKSKEKRMIPPYSHFFFEKRKKNISSEFIFSKIF
jgi:hypothetical protein